MKTIWIMLAVIIVFALGWWWYASTKTVVAPTTANTTDGQVQGAMDVNLYPDNSKDGAADPSY